MIIPDKNVLVLTFICKIYFAMEHKLLLKITCTLFWFHFANSYMYKLKHVSDNIITQFCKIFYKVKSLCILFNKINVGYKRDCEREVSILFTCEKHAVLY